MGDNVVEFTGITRLDIPPDRILEASKGKLSSVVVIGYAEDGSEYFASSMADGGETLWLLERCKMALISMPEEMADAFPPAG